MSNGTIDLLMFPFSATSQGRLSLYIIWNDWKNSSGWMYDGWTASMNFAMSAANIRAVRHEYSSVVGWERVTITLGVLLVIFQKKGKEHSLHQKPAPMHYYKEDHAIRWTRRRKMVYPMRKWSQSGNSCWKPSREQVQDSSTTVRHIDVRGLIGGYGQELVQSAWNFRKDIQRNAFAWEVSKL